VRAYPALLAAETTVQGERAGAVNAAFRVLAGYIFGANTPRERIAMTAPVTQERAPSPRRTAAGGERIAMTAPVTQEPAAGEGEWLVRFFMPAGYRLETLPDPTDPRVRLSEIPARRVAALSFSGLWTQSTLDQRTDELRARIAAAGLRVAPGAAPVFAFYDPPWTPFFMRRNEVMLDLEPPGS
jgi:hypothetical protein